MIYADIFRQYKLNGTRWRIFNSVRSIRHRILKTMTVAILSFGLIVSFIFVREKLSIVGFIIYAISFWLTSIILYLTQRNLDKKNIEDFIKSFQNIDFTTKEKNNITLLLDKIQKVWLDSLLSEKKNDGHHIKQLVTYSKEYTDLSKLKLESIKEIGFAAAILILLSNYFSTIYKKWEMLTIEQITLNTFYMAILITIISFVLLIIKKITLDWLNTDYRHHINLYLILKRAEEVAK